MGRACGIRRAGRIRPVLSESPIEGFKTRPKRAAQGGFIQHVGLRAVRQSDLRTMVIYHQFPLPIPDPHHKHKQ